MNPLVAWVKEREAIRKKKEAGEPPPWSEDPIFQQFRFCNAFREDDKVTRWIFENWLFPHKEDPHVWFAMAVARHVNLPATLSDVGYPVPWKPKKFLNAIRSRKASGTTAYNSAYMIRAASNDQWVDKAAYLSEAVLGNLWKQRKQLMPTQADTLASFHERLQNCFGLGSFMAAQIIADSKHVLPLKTASDWWEFAASGPGSRKGLNRLLGRPPNAPWKEQEWRAELAKLREKLKPEFAAEGIPWCDAQNSQNQLCEIAKYLKAKLGEGRPKQRYPGTATLLNTR